MCVEMLLLVIRFGLGKTIKKEKEEEGTNKNRENKAHSDIEILSLWLNLSKHLVSHN